MTATVAAAAPRRTLAVVAAATALALVAAPVCARTGATGAGALLGIVFVVLVAVRPVLGACALVGIGPLVIGVDRGTVVPLLRLNEAILVAVCAGLVLRALVAPRARVRPCAPDVAVVVLAFAGCVVPLVFRYVRSGTVTSDEVQYAAQVVKLAAVYAACRVAVRDADEARIVVRALASSVCVVSVIGLLQVANAPGVRAVLRGGLFANAGDDAAIGSGRGTSTVGSSIGSAGLQVFTLLLVLSWRSRADAPRRFCTVVSIVLLVGIASTAQFSALIGLLVAGASFAVAARRDRRARRDAGALVAADPATRRAHALYAAAGAITAVVAALVFAPRLGAFASGGVPHSWSDRWANLHTNFLPPLARPLNLLVGVTPVAKVPDPRGNVVWVWIESGYVWLLWTGGLILAAAFVAMLVVHHRRAAIGARRDDVLGAAASASRRAIVVLAALMVLDPHLTMRGSSDAFFPILALGASATAALWPRVARRPT